MLCVCWQKQELETHFLFFFPLLPLFDTFLRETPVQGLKCFLQSPCWDVTRHPRRGKRRAPFCDRVLSLCRKVVMGQPCVTPRLCAPRGDVGSIPGLNAHPGKGPWHPSEGNSHSANGRLEIVSHQALMDLSSPFLSLIIPPLGRY